MLVVGLPDDVDVAPSDVSKLDPEDLLQGGPAVRIAASVNGGVIFDVRPKDNSTTDNDEDKDGIDDSKEGNASVASYGAAPAVLIGSAAGPVAIPCARRADCRRTCKTRQSRSSSAAAT